MRFLIPLRLFAILGTLAAQPLVSTASGSRLGVAPPALAEEFVQACASRLELTEAQRTGLRAYLEQEIEFMNVQSANHSAAEVAELVPAEREQLQRVAGHLMSPTQLRQFRDLEATPQMKAYLKKMSLGD
jgi:hypothetical protein